MEHSHTTYNTIRLSNAFKLGIALNIAYIVIEIFAGLRAGSMALVADAGHNFSDVLVLTFSWMAIAVSRRKPTMKFTYGFRRSTILVALLNTILLIAAVVVIVVETFRRLRNPGDVNPAIVIVTASIGIFVNGLTAWLFMKEQKHDLNIRSAFIHFVGDALVSLGVVAAGIIIALTHILWVDSAITLLIVGVILYSSCKLLLNSVNLALDAVPENIDIEEVKKYLEGLPHVTSIHDLHIWALSTSDAALTVHLMTEVQTDSAFISEIQKCLDEKYSIGHSTIQVEFGEHPGGCKNCN